jgi:predicted  nucleic acid-binding Zn-ribbon protein
MSDQHQQQPSPGKAAMVGMFEALGKRFDALEDTQKEIKDLLEATKGRDETTAAELRKLQAAAGEQAMAMARLEGMVGNAVLGFGEDHKKLRGRVAELEKRTPIHTPVPAPT